MVDIGNQWLLVHAFPRKRETRSQRDEFDVGLSTLKSIFDIGLVLSPELLEFPLVGGLGNNDKGTRVFQRRVCFTFVSSRDLVEHAAIFGSFAVTFLPEMLRELGAVPVFYVPRPISRNDVDTYSNFSNAIIHQIRDISVLLEELIGVQREFDRVSTEEIVTVAVDGEREQQMHVKTALGLLRNLQGQKGDLTVLRGFIWALANLFYHADSARENDIFRKLDFSYYRQAEWRIIAGLKIGEERLDRTINEEERMRLSQINPLFSGEIQLPDGEIKRRDEVSRTIAVFKGKPLRTFIHHVVVPAQCREEAEAVLSGHGIEIPVVEIDYGEVEQYRRIYQSE